MHVVADTDALVAQGVISEDQAREMETRSRATMMALAINTVLCLGILSVTGGLVFWLQDAAAVAISGLAIAFAGVLTLMRGQDGLHMFGGAAVLIGVGMLTGGGALELVDKHENLAGPVLAVAGGIVLAGAGWLFARDVLNAPFVVGAVMVIGLAMHLGGLAFLLDWYHLRGLPTGLFFLYAAALMAATGWFLDVRLISALAIVPFAQMLETGTAYFHAVYAFYSPEPTLTILQMAALIVACLWLARTQAERTGRHARTLAVLAFVVANLCALVGSLWGDVVGETLWGPMRADYIDNVDGQSWYDARQAFRQTALVIPDEVFAILWAAALIALALWAANKGNRGLFNTALVFGVIHAYTQMFESFADEPLAYVIGGLVLIPIAWGMWKMDQRLKDASPPT